MTRTASRNSGARRFVEWTNTVLDLRALVCARADLFGTVCRNGLGELSLPPRARLRRHAYLIKTVWLFPHLPVVDSRFGTGFGCRIISNRFTQLLLYPVISKKVRNPMESTGLLLRRRSACSPYCIGWEQFVRFRRPLYRTCPSSWRPSCATR